MKVFGPQRPAGCPSNLALDEFAAGDLAATPDDVALREHLARCAPCRERLATRRADPALSFDAGAAGAESLGAAAAVRRHRGRGRGNAAMVTGAGGLAAAAVMLLVWNLDVRAPAPAPARERTKGALALTVHVTRGAAPPEAITEDDDVRTGDELRFSLALSAPGHAVVLSLRADAAAPPVVAQYVPAAAGTRPVPVGPPGPVMLETSVVAHGGAGLERVFAVVCRTETSPQTLRERAEAALARAGQRPEMVLSLATGCSESSVLLRRER